MASSPFAIKADVIERHPGLRGCEFRILRSGMRLQSDRREAFGESLLNLGGHSVEAQQSEYVPEALLHGRLPMAVASGELTAKGAGSPASRASGVCLTVDFT